MSFFLKTTKTISIAEQKPWYATVMQCKSLYTTTITDVTTPYNTIGIAYASSLYTDMVKIADQ
jgi:hypothetical protein